MSSFRRFLVAEDGTAIAEYAFTLAIFAVVVIAAMVSLQFRAGNSLVRTRAAMTCSSAALRSSTPAVDANGGITCS